MIKSNQKYIDTENRAVVTREEGVKGSTWGHKRLGQDGEHTHTFSNDRPIAHIAIIKILRL